MRPRSVAAVLLVLALIVGIFALVILTRTLLLGRRRLITALVVGALALDLGLHLLSCLPDVVCGFLLVGRLLVAVRARRDRRGPARCSALREGGANPESKDQRERDTGHHDLTPQHARLPRLRLG